jgi:hypothetical protein
MHGRAMLISRSVPEGLLLSRSLAEGFGQGDTVGEFRRLGLFRLEQ